MFSPHRMPTLAKNAVIPRTILTSKFQNQSAAAAVVLLGGLARMWSASGTFLNPDEALHFRLANQLSLAQAYRESLTASHPPLLTFILYFWRSVGTAEIWLRMPSILAALAFCWFFYKWLANAAGALTAFSGLLLVAFLPPIVTLGAEIRQYSLLLAFLASALFFLDGAFEKSSIGRMWVFSLCLYFAMLSHYSAFLLAAALGVYAVFRILQEFPPRKLVAAWTIGQLGGVALAIFLYKAHLSKLGVGESRTALEGWMSEFFLRSSYFNPTHDHYLTFLIGHTFGVFQYFFGQLAVGDLMGLLFVAGLAFLLLGKSSFEKSPAVESQIDRLSLQRLGILLVLAFTTAMVASVAHVYPYGGTRHMVFLIIPAVAGVSVAIARLASEKWPLGIAITIFIVAVCVLFGKERPPRMERADQSRERMAAAMSFIEQNAKPSEVIFTDYQTDLLLGHYLCRQRPISFETAQPSFEQFTCADRHIVSRNYKGWIFGADNFPQEWQRFVSAYKPTPGHTIWVVQAGWGVDLPEALRSHYGQFRNLQFESFGKNIEIFKLTAGQAMPLSSATLE